MTLTWSPADGGTVGGDANAAQVVRGLARAYDGQLLGLPGCPHTTEDHLSSPYTAKLLMQLVLARTPRPQLVGNLPKLPDPPQGAVR